MIVNGFESTNFEEGKEKAIENLMDLYTKICPTNETFYFYNHVGSVIRKDYPEFVSHQNELHNQARLLMIDHGYAIHDRPNSVNASLTQLGRHVKRIGGHYKYIESLETEKTRHTEKEKVELDNLIVTNKVNNWLYKTRWLPHILALLALIVSIVALAISLKTPDKTDKPNSHRQEVNKQIKTNLSILFYMAHSNI